MVNSVIIEALYFLKLNATNQTMIGLTLQFLAIHEIQIVINFHHSNWTTKKYSNIYQKNHDKQKSKLSSGICIYLVKCYTLTVATLD